MFRLIYRIEQIRLREAARENAITATLLEFIPRGAYSGVISVGEMEREHYEYIGLSGAYRQMETRVYV